MPKPDVALISPYPGVHTPADQLSGVAAYARSLVGALGNQGLRVTMVRADDDRRSDDGTGGHDDHRASLQQRRDRPAKGRRSRPTDWRSDRPPST